MSTLSQANINYLEIEQKVFDVTVIKTAACSNTVRYAINNLCKNTETITVLIQRMTHSKVTRSTAKLWWIAICPVVCECGGSASVSLRGWRASLALGWQAELATSAQHLLRAQLEAISRVWKGHSWISRLSSKINDAWQSVYVCVFPLSVAGGVPLISGLCDPHSRHWEINAIITRERGIAVTAGVRRHNVLLHLLKWHISRIARTLLVVKLADSMDTSDVQSLNKSFKIVNIFRLCKSF